MISFYPGPSRVHDEIPKYVKEAFKKGILSINHRSSEFMEISEKTIRLLQKKLEIPEDYTLFYASSATECWEIIAQSLITKRSYHIFNGAFGEKWFTYARRIASGVRSYPFGKDEIINPKKFRFGQEGGIICITQNETSNGTQVSNEIIRSIKENNENHLVAIDATSSMGGITLDFKSADIWFASVQKCFGLPAGLGIMACSPAAIRKVKETGETDHYNSLSFMTQMMEKWQTPYTPNVLGIYLLMRVMEKSPPIGALHKKVKRRYEEWMDFLDQGSRLQHFIKNREAHSYTVIPVSASRELVATLKKEAKKKGLLLGEGYGELKAETFRIANFPALKKREIAKLKSFLAAYI